MPCQKRIDGTDENGEKISWSVGEAVGEELEEQLEEGVFGDYSEVARTTTIVTIEDPDSEASIDVERIDSIEFEHSVSGGRIKLNLNWS